MTGNDLEHLVESREQFLRFIQRHIDDPGVAEDILQSSLLKLVQNYEKLRDQDRLLPWFYAILRNAIVDHYRARGARAEVEMPAELDVEDEPEAVTQLCECFRSLLPTLKDEYADVIDALDLRSESTETAIRRLGVTANNLKVRHYRARQALRRKLEETCHVCAEHHCLDCTCQSGVDVR